MKLIKNVVGEYYLVVLHKNLPKWYNAAFELSNGYYAIASSTKIDGVGEFPMLSQKNCDSIALGYDLDELFQREIDELMFTGNLEDPSEYRSGMYKGAKILLEILADRRFTEEDMKKALHRLATSFMRGYSFDKDIDFQEGDRIIQSRQQNEWDVEVEMEEVDVQFDIAATSLSDYNHFTVTRKPKLDAYGRLILKRV